MMVRIDVDESTRDRFEALAHEAGLPVCDTVRTLSHASSEVLRRLDLRRVMAEEREREAQSKSEP